jgi:hypothetical protein
MDTSSEWLMVKSTPPPEEPEASRFINCGIDEVRVLMFGWCGMEF